MALNWVGPHKFIGPCIGFDYAITGLLGLEFAAKQKWKWAGHVARLNDNRWTKRITDWQPRYGKRSRGRQMKRWRDDIVQMKGITWGRDARQRDDWRRDAEGYIRQWMDGASL